MSEQVVSMGTMGRRLARGVGMLVLLEVLVTAGVPFVAGILPREAVLGLLALPVLLMAMVVVRARYVFDCDVAMHPSDVTLARRCGLLAVLMLIPMTAAVAGLHLLREANVDLAGPMSMLFRALICAVIAGGELAICFALLCLLTPRTIGRSSVRRFWKTVCFPLPLVMGYVIVLMATSPDLIPASSGQSPPETSSDVAAALY